MSKVDVSEFIKSFEDYLIIDVRSEKEFLESKIIGAFNVPILDNDEKHEVGLMYKNNKDQAYRMGLEIGSSKLLNIYDQVMKLKEEHKKQKVLFYCFRGGTRSTSVYQSLLLMKLDCYLLDGGIKAYRNFVLSNLDTYVNKFDYLVVTGNTGCGKTKYLHQLKEKGYPVLDLEGLANNRGSIFGSVGLGMPTNQKEFDSLLFFELVKFDQKGANIIFVESESRKIGNALLPLSMMHRLEKGRHLLLSSSIAKRIEIIKEDYLCYDINIERISRLISKNNYFKKRLGRAWTDQLLQCLNTNDMDEFIRMLLEDYYDAFYIHSREGIEQVDSITSDDEDMLVDFLVRNYMAYDQYQKNNPI